MADPRSISFLEVTIGNRVYIPGRREFGNVTQITSNQRRRMLVDVVLDSGATVSYALKNWYALSGISEAEAVARAAAHQPVEQLALHSHPNQRRVLMPAAAQQLRLQRQQRRREDQAQVRQQAQQAARVSPQAARRHPAVIHRPSPQHKELVSAQAIPEIPGPPVPLPVKAKPSRGLWSPELTVTR